MSRALVSSSRSGLLCGLLCVAVLTGCPRSRPELAPSQGREPATPEAVAWPDLDTSPPRTGGGEKDAAVVVAIEDYTAPEMPDVPGARANGLAWFNYLVKTRGVPGTRVRWMLDGEAADREELRSAAEAAAAQVQPGGVLWFVFIGHGVPAKDARDGLLVAADARPTPQSVYTRSLAKADLERELLKGAQARTVVLLDTCFSGRSGSGGPLLPGLQPGLPVMPDILPDVTLLSAGRSDEFAGALPGANRPAFSYLVLGALRGWGDADGNGEVTAEEAVGYARDVLTVLPTGRRQTPQLQGGTAPLVLARGALERGPRLEAMRAGTTPRPRTVDLSSCPGGTADGCVEQGVAYFHGRGVEQDRLKASTAWRTACDAGNMRGCLLLGRQYEAGLGLSRDAVKAARLFALACEGALREACVSAGTLYFAGDGVPRDPERAYSFFRSACEGTATARGEARGCTWMGRHHEMGVGMEKDAARAASYFQRGCDGGDTVGCRLLGELYEAGSGVSRDLQRAQPLYERGCNANDGLACEKLGDLIQVSAPAQALDVYLRGCDNSAPGACHSAGIMLLEGRHVPGDIPRAIQLLERGCSTTDTYVYSCLALANYFLGPPDGDSRNVARAVEAMSQGCQATTDSTNASSLCVNAGHLYLGAPGLPPDEARARGFFRRACQLGNVEGCELAKP